MSAFRSAIAELESALRSGSPGKRTEALFRVTNIIATETEALTNDQISAFDDVLVYLVGHLEQQALAAISQRLAPVKMGPQRTIKELGSNDAIEIAGPVLSSSPLLTDQDLIEITRTKSQAHQLSIAVRPQLAEAVTEALIDRGDSEVVHTVAGNKGAQFSETGFTKLALLANGDDQLSSIVASRPDVPPIIFREILTRASEKVRQKLLTTAPAGSRETLKKALSEASLKLGTGHSEKHYARAQQLVRSFSQDTPLTKKKLIKFAQEKKRDEVVATLAALTAISIELVDRLFYGTEPHGLMTLCRLFALGWDIAQEVLLATPNGKSFEQKDLTALESDYQAITPQMAQRVIRFWESRVHISAAAPQRHIPMNNKAEPLAALGA